MTPHTATQLRQWMSAEMGLYTGLLDMRQFVSILSLCPWDGSRENNILFPNDAFEYVFSEMDGPCVFIDANAKTPDKMTSIHLIG